MYVQSIARTSNGTTNEPWLSGTWFDTQGYLTPGAAWDDLSGKQNTTGIKSSTTRASMQKGVVGFKKYKNTPYYTFRVNYTSPNQRPFHMVDSYVTGGNIRFARHYRDIRFGYTGGGDTGWGYPAESCRYRFGAATIAGAANLVVIANLRNRIQSQAKNKARNTKFDLAESLAGIDKTVIMVASRMRQVLYAWRAAKNGNYGLAYRWLFSKSPKRVRRHLTPAEIWLELIYGWFPLLNDIQAGVKLVNEKLKDPSSTLTVTRRGTDGLPFTGTSWTSLWSGVRVEHNLTTNVETKYVFRVADQTAATLTKYSLDNPLYSVWVILPYSFVVDWLVPVGEWLQGVTGTLGLQFISGYTSTLTGGEVSIEADKYGNSNTVVRRESAKAGWRFVELDREVHTSFPSTIPYYRFPFSNAQRLVSAVALLDNIKRSR